MKMEDGTVMGEHDGVMFYTIGQRQGLNIGGTRGGSGGAWYVIDKDIPNNILVVAQDPDHPRLLHSECHLTNLHWISGRELDAPLDCNSKMRYRHPDQACTVTQLDGDRAHVRFETPQRALTPGQSLVFYLGNQCLGGGVIDNF